MCRRRCTSRRSSNRASVSYELEIAGGLAGEPIDVVKCRTIDLEVPALAEIVLEGELTIPGENRQRRAVRRVLRLHDAASAERTSHDDQGDHPSAQNPIYHNIWLGKPPHEHLYVDALTYAVAAYQELKPAYPALKKAYAPPWGVSIVLILQLEKRLMRRGIVDNILAVVALHPQRQMEACDRRRRRYQYRRSQRGAVGADDAIPAGDGYVRYPARASRAPWNLRQTADGVTSKLMLDLTIKENFRGEVAEPTAAHARNGFAAVEGVWIQIGARRRRSRSKVPSVQAFGEDSERGLK